MVKKILLFSRDPGASNTVIPLVGPLISKGYEVELYGKDYALKRYSKFGLSGKDITQEILVINEISIENFLKKKKFDFIITGSSNDLTEKYIWEVAKKLNIPSLAILDQWVNYGVRFSRYLGKDLRQYVKGKKHEYFPDKIAVMDEYAKEEMKKEGISLDLILVSGQPYFQLLNEIKMKDFFTCKKIKDFFKKENCDLLITYISEVNDDNGYLGYTSQSIFCELLKALGKIKTDKKIGLIIKLHPRESIDDYLDLKLFLKESDIPFIFENKLNSWEIANISNFICGMTSIFLIESVILRKSVMSIQIGLKQQNSFVLDRKGILKSILDGETLIKELEKIIIHGNFPKYNFDIIKNPVENIIKYVESVLCQN